MINRPQKPKSPQGIVHTQPRQDAAEALALQGLAWLAGDPDELGAFLSYSGMDGTQLRSSAGSPEVLAGVLDYLLADETRLLAFCAAAECDPSLPARLRPALPGSGEW